MDHGDMDCSGSGEEWTHLASTIQWEDVKRFNFYSEQMHTISNCSTVDSLPLRSETQSSSNKTNNGKSTGLHIDIIQQGSGKSSF
jgi:hypothetical protein